MKFSCRKLTRVPSQPGPWWPGCTCSSQPAVGSTGNNQLAVYLLSAVQIVNDADALHVFGGCTGCTRRRRAAPCSCVHTTPCMAPLPASPSSIQCGSELNESFLCICELGWIHLNGMETRPACSPMSAGAKAVVAPGLLARKIASSQGQAHEHGKNSHRRRRTVRTGLSCCRRCPRRCLPLQTA